MSPTITKNVKTIPIYFPLSFIRNFYGRRERRPAESARVF